ncbi:extracellular solute-binding protein [Paenibacillus sp. LHD-117]|uniref:ABC transporter substrate-binding protein n=1 Tax=Paenibacillus sp. LHD-117 TaxID=3071412 RepID=UPI0027E064A9|nr:extracellular solute-binding protein [Paenibacillus sp. LHD-117]MDQ6417928.1 extracellular solute-binding protein [Paenibacillus sp. LHD-117]
MQKHAKIFIAMLLGLILLFALSITGCSSSSGNITGSSERNDNVPKQITLKLLNIWPEHHATLDKTLAIHKEKYPHVNIEVTTISYDQATPTLQLSMASGDVYDVSFMWPHQIYKMVAVGETLNLDPYFEADPAWKDSFISQSVYEAAKRDGHVYGIPFKGSTSSIVAYNKTLFEANGWKVPASLEEMESLMSEIEASGIVPLTLFGKPNGGLIKSLFEHFTVNELIQQGRALDTDVLNRRVTDMPYEAAGAQIRDWYNSGFISANPFALSREESRAAFFAKKSAMQMMNNNELAAMKEMSAKSDFELGFFAFPKPVASKDVYISGGFDGFFVSARSKHPDEAVDVLKTLTSPEVQKLWSEETSAAAVVKGIKYEDEDLKSIAVLMIYVMKYEKRPDYDAGTFTNDILAAELSKYLLSEDYSPKQFGDYLNAELEKYLEKMSE